MFFVMHSGNSKIGASAATYASIAKTCPSSCPLRGEGCYAQGGNVGMHVRRLDARTADMSADDCARLEALEIEAASYGAPKGHPLRLHVSGDATTARRAGYLARAAKRWQGPVWTYTHAWRNVPRHAWGRVSVLASCEQAWQASAALDAGYAPSLVVSEHPADGKAYRDAFGTKIIPCPSQTRGVLCTECKLCWQDSKLVKDRAAIAFSAHGVSKKRALFVIQNKDT